MTHPSQISSTTIFASQTTMGINCTVEDFCVIGISGTESVSIGNSCHIRSHAVIYHGAKLGEQVQIGHGALIREFSVLGDRVSIGSHSVVEHHVVIESGVRVHSNVFIPELTHLEANVWIGPCVVFTNARYPAAAKTKQMLSGVRVQKNAKIGAGVVILPGITIGEGALIGSGAVITKDVPAGKVVVGNPGRIVSEVSSIQYPDGSFVYAE